ncbi:MAG: restriction endonuclease subunit S [Methylococcales bacterium]|nr:restriction endonuclease subunit S [Methylococcales bacterium]
MDKAMQDSGVEWIEKSPQHWKKDKIYRLAELISSGGTPSSTNEGFYGGDIMWVQTGDLNNDFIYKSSKQITLEGLKNSSAKIFPKNTLLIAMYGATIGKLGILTAEAATNQACCAIFVSKKMNIKFTFYLFMAMKDYLVFQSYGGGQPNISQEIIKQQYVYYPHFLEQQTIAEYLDQQCGKLDAIIAIKQQQIKTLDALRQSVIYQAVTKGLDASAPLVDSGVEWLGKIPQRWKPYRIKDVAKLSPTYSEYKPDQDDNCTVVAMECVSANGVIDTSNIEQYKNISNGLTFFEKGDVIFAKITPCMENGKGAYITNLPTKYAFGSTEFHVLRSGNKLDGKFLYYYTYNSSFRNYAAENMTGAAGQKRVSANFFKYTVIYLPSIEEQQRIADHLDQETQRLNALKANLNQQLSTLEAYKKSLIYECVTGKKRVKS